MAVTFFLVVAIVGGFYMAWNIGANDVANAFGASVGSGALTIRKAILLAAIFEFAGAFLVGAPVAETISGKIVVTDHFALRHDVMGIGMVAALLAAALWLNIATFFSQPVSTTHAIIGAVIGFAVVACGPACVRWSEMGRIASSWVVSPLVGGVLAYLIYRFGVKRYVLESRHPVFMAMVFIPFAASGLLAIVTFSIIYKGLPGLRLNLPLGWAAPLAAAVGATVYLVLHLALRRRKWRHRGPRRMR
jgi:PiT family inorganic phosphate transporter